MLAMAHPRRIGLDHARRHHRGRCRSELAHVLQYLIRVADVLEVDLAEAVRKKVQLNERRFLPPPVMFRVMPPG
jgi:hypothetical protein